MLFAKGYGAPYTPPGGISNILSGRPKEEQRKLLETCLPLSMWDKHRIRRALLRFQLYCELFHQPGNSLDNEGDWEERVSEQELFWLRYEWWEVEEVKCIYQLLVFSLALDYPRENSGSETQNSLEGSLQERGLPQLRHFLDGTNTTLLGENYLRKFLSRAFYGFSKADPDDFNYFSLPRPLYRPHFAAAMIKPPGTYRSLTSSANKSRRWEPSPYPGVQLEHITDPTLNPTLPAECRPLKSKPQELKKFVRLIGWVFWDPKNSMTGWNLGCLSMSFAWWLETLIKIGIIVGMVSLSGGRIAMKRRMAKFNPYIGDAIMQYWLRIIDRLYRVDDKHHMRDN